MEYWGIMFEHGNEKFSIFDQDMTQKIYENYLGIFGITEIQFASQPRAKTATWT